MRDQVKVKGEKMKKILLAVMVAAATSAFAKEKRDVYDIRPDAAKMTDAPTAVEWQNANDMALKAATDDAALAAFVADESSAKALLARVEGAYRTDPTVAFQVAAVSQWVMLDDPWYCLFWDGQHAAGRKVWMKALCAAARGATDDYVKSFCLDQIRWCGCPCCAKCVAAFAAQEKSKAVKDIADIVVRELERK